MQANIEPMLEVEGSRLNLPGKIAAILSTRILSLPIPLAP